MTKVTYKDPNDDAPKITWQGVVFRAHQAVEVSNKELVEAAKNHPYFEVEDGEEVPSGKPTWPDEDEPPKKGKR